MEYLLASLLESYSMLVTALEANTEVPSLDVLIERLLHEERKQKEREEDKDQSRALATYSRMGVRCYHCGKLGYIKRNCPQSHHDERNSRQFSRRKDSRHKVDKASRGDYESDNEGDVLVVTHTRALQASNSTKNWIVDSGATCNMCSS